MLKVIAILVLVLTGAVLGVYAQKNDAKTAADETAIREIVKQIEVSWNAKSGAGFAAPFAPDADYVVVNGMYIKGREAIEKGHTQIFSTVYKDSQLGGTIKSLRFLRADVAVVHVEWNLVYRFEGKETKTMAMNTMFMTKEKGKWSIVAFQNTPIPAENR